MINKKQRALLLLELHVQNNNKESDKLINDSFLEFGLFDENQINSEKEIILLKYKTGIKNLNKNQLNNLLNLIIENNYSETDIKNKLKFYDINKDYHLNILEFFKDFEEANKIIYVDKLDDNFKGLQVATRDSFNEIIKLGWTGDWIISPESLRTNMIQIASMSETGNHTRGSYINAEILKIEPKDYNGQTRYRIFINNPIIINTGNRNIKFNNNPVKYIT